MCFCPLVSGLVGQLVYGLSWVPTSCPPSHWACMRCRVDRRACSSPRRWVAAGDSLGDRKIPGDTRGSFRRPARGMVWVSRVPPAPWPCAKAWWSSGFREPEWRCPIPPNTPVSLIVNKQFDTSQNHRDSHLQPTDVRFLGTSDCDSSPWWKRVSVGRQPLGSHQLSGSFTLQTAQAPDPGSAARSQAHFSEHPAARSMADLGGVLAMCTA